MTRCFVAICLTGCDDGPKETAVREVPLRGVVFSVVSTLTVGHTVL